MIDAKKVKARDVMHAKVVRLEASMPVETAIGTLEEAHISGAPVVDAAGKVVGMLSLADIAKAEHTARSRIDTGREEYALMHESEELDEMDEQEILGMEHYNPETLGGDTVADWMNPEVISVSPDASLKKVCQTLAAHDIHRVLVIEAKQLVGIITTSDIVRYLGEQG